MYKKLLVFLSFLVITNCQSDLSIKDRISLQEMYDRKLQELREATSSHAGGWPSDEDCDAALWAGVARAAGADWIDMTAAIQANGRPTRKPYIDCETPLQSRTTTSNDMMTGIMLGNFVAGNKDALKSLWDYGYAHSWIMGYPEWYVARVLLRPNGISLLARSLYILSDGDLDYAMRLSPVVYGPVSADFEYHLALLSRYLQKLTDGPQYGTEVVEGIISQVQPLDALAHAVVGNKEAAAGLLLSDYESPTYVRGHPNYHLCHWLLAAYITLSTR